MFWISVFAVCGLVTLACALVGAIGFVVSSFKHEGIDSGYYE